MLQLGFRLELYRSAQLQVPFDLVRLAEDLGFHSVWTAEAYGSDALSPLAAIAPVTRRIKLGTAVVQLAARPPATLAMQAMTIDALAGGGRMIIGIGVSGPQIVEGWYGQPWGKPNARLRDYITILRKVIAREGPVTHEGPEISLPYRGPGALGQGKALKSILHSPSDIPIWLASVGPRNTELCAELCDGWLPMGLPPEGTDDRLPTSSGAASPSERPIVRSTTSRCSPGSPSTSPTTCRDGSTRSGPSARPTWAGWGASRTTTTSRRWPGAASPRRRRASRSCSSPAAARRRSRRCRTKRMLQGALVGSPARIREQWAAGGVVAPGVTGVIVGADRAEELELIAELVGARDA